MSISGLFSIGTSALQAAYAGLQTTGNNIANVNTPGYSRQTVVQTTAGSNFTGGGYIGRGVETTTVQREYDQFLGAAVTSATSAAAGDQVRADMLSTLDNLFADTTNGIGAAIDDLSSAFADLVDNPSDGSARTVVLGRAGTLAERISTASSGLLQMRDTVDARIGADVRTLNSSLSQLASINTSIAASAANGQTPNDLLDQRDAVVDTINRYLKTSQYVNPDGTVSLFSASGQTLVLGNDVATVSLDYSGSSAPSLVIDNDGNETKLPGDLLGGGELYGLMTFRDTDLQAASDRLDQLATSIASEFNDQQALGFDANGQSGAALFGIDTAPTFGGAATFRVALTSGSQIAAASSSALSDNENARSLLAVGTGAHDMPPNGSAPAVTGKSFTDVFADLLADVGARSQSATASAKTSSQVLGNAQAASAQVSGVNLDEEAARLLQYQQAYQAAAKVITTAETIFQALLDAASQ